MRGGGVALLRHGECACCQVEGERPVASANLVGACGTFSTQWHGLANDDIAVALALFGTEAVRQNLIPSSVPNLGAGFGSAACEFLGETEVIVFSTGGHVGGVGGAATVHGQALIGGPSVAIHLAQDIY